MNARGPSAAREPVDRRGGFRSLEDWPVEHEMVAARTEHGLLDAPPSAPRLLHVLPIFGGRTGGISRMKLILRACLAARWLNSKCEQNDRTQMTSALISPPSIAIIAELRPRVLQRQKQRHDCRSRGLSESGWWASPSCRTPDRASSKHSCRSGRRHLVDHHRQPRQIPASSEC